MKIGRNDPCPCGSGKKYKKCCMGKAAAPSLELYYRRLSDAYDRLLERLLEHVLKTFGKEAGQVAMDEFLLWPGKGDEVTEEVLDRVGPLFLPWYVFNWEYDPEATDVELSGPEECTVAELYAAERGTKIDALEGRLIESINRVPYSFWEVLGVDKGKGMTVQDILRGVRIEVQERAGSEYVSPGDVLFGRVVSVDRVGMFVGLAQTLIPPGRKPDILRLRKELMRHETAITLNSLYEWDTEIRRLFLHIDRGLHSRPQMRNTDGHELEFHRLVYDVSSADEAFQKLCGLCVTMTPEELGAEAERNRTGRIVRVEIPWDRRKHSKMSAMPNTLLGRIVLDGRRLSAEVNSAERAAALRREIDACLGNTGRFRVDEIQDFESMMSRIDPEADESGETSDHEKLMQLPEVQDQLAKMMLQHWEDWVDQKLPALGGKSPRQAVKTADGREAVEALLMDAEKSRGRDPFTAQFNRTGAQRAREILGL